MPLGNWKGNGEMCGCQNEIGATKLGQRNCVNILLTIHHLNRIVTVSIAQCSRTHIGMGLVNLTFESSSRSSSYDQARLCFQSNGLCHVTRTWDTGLCSVGKSDLFISIKIFRAYREWLVW